MVNYREILRLRNLGYTQRQIALSVHSSRKTISEVFVLANEKGLFWPLTEEMTNEDIRKMLYPDRIQKGERRMPDCAYLNKEMAKSSVTLTLLWSEYAQQCRNEDQIPLPASHYEMAVWATAKVPLDYLITVDKNKYSVPYNRVASHVRQYGYCDPQIQPGHMPVKHRKYLNNNADTFLDWAKTVGKSTHAIMQLFISPVKVEQMSYKNCRALMKLADTYPLARI